MYGVCTLFHSVGGDGTSILSQRPRTADVRTIVSPSYINGCIDVPTRFSPTGYQIYNIYCLFFIKDCLHTFLHTVGKQDIFQSHQNLVFSETIQQV